MKTVQYFTDEYLRESSKLSTTEIARFLDEFQRAHQQRYRSVSIVTESDVCCAYLGKSATSGKFPVKRR
jgi:hypothetical protein